MTRANSNSGKAQIDVFLNYYKTPQFLDDTVRLAEQFNAAHPQHQVNIHGCNYLDLPRQVYEAVKEGRPPAIAEYFYTSAQLARDMLDKDGSPLFMSVQEATAGRTEILGEPVRHDDLIPAVRDYYEFDGQLFSVPTLASTILLYANTTLLRAANVPAVPATWREMDAACEAVARLSDGPPHAITWPNHGWFFYQAVAQQGALLTDHANGRAGRAQTIYLDSDQMLAYVQWWQRLHRDGHFLYTSEQPLVDDPMKIWEDNFAAFADQRVAFCISSSVDTERMVQAGRDAGFTVQAAQFPYNDSVRCHGNLIGGDSLWLAAGLDDDTRDGALAFIEYLNNPRLAAERHKSSGYLPITQASVELLERENWFGERPYRRTAIDLLSAATDPRPVPGTLVGNLARIQSELITAMHDVLVNSADPAKRFTQANERAQLLLTDYNAHCLGTAPGPRGPNNFDVG